jgi:hypothetical protein
MAIIAVAAKENGRRVGREGFKKRNRRIYKLPKNQKVVTVKIYTWCV